jgi:ATP-dependent 26S proteasome regulatory subunit
MTSDQYGALFVGFIPGILLAPFGLPGPGKTLNARDILDFFKFIIYS